MAIIALTAVVLLDQRMNIVKDAGRARDLRTTWVLASQKLAELQLDKTLWGGLGGTTNGDFGDVNPDYGAFLWESQIVREQIDTTDPAAGKDAKDDPKKRELFRVTLTVRTPGIDQPVVIEAEFTINPPKPEGSDTTVDPSKSGSKDLQKQPDPGIAPPGPGGVKR